MRMNAFDALWGLAQAIMRIPDLDAITGAIANADPKTENMVCPLLVAEGTSPLGAIIVAQVVGESIAIPHSPHFITWFKAALGNHAKVQPTVKVFADALELWLMSTPEGRDFKRVFSPVLVIYGAGNNVVGVYSEGQERAAIMRALDMAGHKAVAFVEVGELEKAGEFLFRTANFLGGYDASAAGEARDLATRLTKMSNRVRDLVATGDPNAMTINVLIRDDNEGTGGAFAPLDRETRAGLEKFYLDLANARETLALAMKPPAMATAPPKTDETAGPGWKIGEAFTNQKGQTHRAILWGTAAVIDAEDRFSPGSAHF